MTDREHTPQTQDVQPTVKRASEPPAAQPLAGSAPALGAIFEAEAGYVGLSLRRLGVRERDLEDMTHDVFVIVHRQLPKYDRERPIRPWLFGIAMRVAIAYRRRAGHQLEIVRESPDAVDAGPLADEQLDAYKMRQVVLKALDELRPEPKAVFIMHDIDGHAMPDIAGALAIPLNTGYSRLRAARAQFAEAVARILGGRRTP